MTALQRYGNVRIAKIKRAYDDLRQAVRAHDAEAAETALDRYEQWADYAFGQDPMSDRRVAALVELMPEVIASLEAEGLNVSLVKDVRAALAGLKK